jgi:uncharacterized protein YndB with AHSA1/START domain
MKRIAVALFAALLAIPTLALAQDKELSTVQTIRIKATPEAVWAYAGDFGGIARWFSLVQSSKLVLRTKNEEGAIRELVRGNGTKVREKLVEYDPGSMRMSYTYVDGQVIAKDYFSTMELKDAGNGETEVVWSGRFKRLDDAPAEQDEAALVALYTSIYKRGLEALKARVEGGA